ELRIVPHLLNADAQIVASSLSGYRRAVNPVYQQNVHQAIEALIISKAAAPGDVVAIFSEMARAATEQIVNGLMNKLTGLQTHRFEDLIGKIVEQGGYRILKWRQNDGQGGDADIVAEAELPPLAAVLEQRSILLVQVKLKKDVDPDDIKAVDQLI